MLSLLYFDFLLLIITTTNYINIITIHVCITFFKSLRLSLRQLLLKYGKSAQYSTPAPNNKSLYSGVWEGTFGWKSGARYEFASYAA